MQAINNSGLVLCVMQGEVFGELLKSPYVAIAG
jgi:hypothetical protein